MERRRSLLSGGCIIFGFLRAPPDNKREGMSVSYKDMADSGSLSFTPLAGLLGDSMANESE